MLVVLVVEARNATRPGGDVGGRRSVVSSSPTTLLFVFCRRRRRRRSRPLRFRSSSSSVHHVARTPQHRSLHLWYSRTSVCTTVVVCCGCFWIGCDRGIRLAQCLAPHPLACILRAFRLQPFITALVCTKEQYRNVRALRRRRRRLRQPCMPRDEEFTPELPLRECLRARTGARERSMATQQHLKIAIAWRQQRRQIQRPAQVHL